MILARNSALAVAFILAAVELAQAQDRVTLGFVYHGELPADEREMVEDPVAVATAVWVDSVRVFLGPEVLQLQAYGWYEAREGESPHYVIQIVGLPVMASDVATGMVVLAVTVLEADPEEDAWHYVGQSVDYYEGDARDAVPRIIDTLSSAIESHRND
jgi:hypothetical protein